MASLAAKLLADARKAAPFLDWVIDKKASGMTGSEAVVTVMSHQSGIHFGIAIDEDGTFIGSATKPHNGVNLLWVTQSNPTAQQAVTNLLRELFHGDPLQIAAPTKQDVN